MNIESEWESFLNEEKNDYEPEKKEEEHIKPICYPLKISTKSKMCYFNQLFDLETIFWNVDLIHYDDLKFGPIKKQMKFTFTNKEKIIDFEKKYNDIKGYKNQYIVTQIDNPNGRIEYKDVRKVDIGYCKKDLYNVSNYKKNKKNSFYNCLVIIYRDKVDDILDIKYKEYHIKIFYSGKIEIPGIFVEEEVDRILIKFKDIYKKIYPSVLLEEKENTRSNILVNSNFKTNFNIQRKSFYQILKSKYNIKCSFDPCIYPGIRCIYNFDNETKLTFMIFRTGSLLILGKCNDTELYFVYNFISDILIKEYINIREISYEPIEPIILKKNKKTKIIKIMRKIK